MPNPEIKVNGDELPLDEFFLELSRKRDTHGRSYTLRLNAWVSFVNLQKQEDTDVQSDDV